MLNLILLYYGLVINLICGFFLIYLSNFKSLGMQTLYDCVFNHFLKSTMLNCIAMTIVYTLGTFVHTLHPFFAASVLCIWDILALNLGLSLIWMAIVRYILVFHSQWLTNTQDETFMHWLRGSNFGISLYLFANDFVLNYDFETSGSYCSMIGCENIPLNDEDPISAQFIFGIAILAFAILHIRLEIFNYKHGEGLLVMFKKFFSFASQNESNESEEFGIKFMRVFSFAAIVALVLSFFSGIIYFESYTLFGYQAFVSASQLIQLFVVDIGLIVIIIQNPVAQKRLRMLRGSNAIATN